MNVLDNKSPVTLYYQVELKIRRLIEKGDFKSGDPIPGEKELMDTYQVSRITIRKALERLEEDGLIIKKRGARSVVSDQIPNRLAKSYTTEDFRGIEDELRHQGLCPKASVFEHISLLPTEAISEIFQIGPDTELIRIRRLGEVDGVPIWLESRYFPRQLGEKLDADKLENESVLSLMLHLGYQVSDVEIRLEAVVATSQQAKLLKVPTGTPLLLHQSIAYDALRRVLQLTRTYLRSDYYKLIIYAKPQAGLPGLEITGGGYLVGKNKI